jgi:hypothetical protein
MALGNFTRQYLESRAADRVGVALQALADLDALRNRTAAELAAGTLDTAEFYGSGAPHDATDKANIVGALDQAHAIYQWLVGGGLVAAPAGDPLAYAKFLIG